MKKLPTGWANFENLNIADFLLDQLKTKIYFRRFNVDSFHDLSFH